MGTMPTRSRRGKRWLLLGGLALAAGAAARFWPARAQPPNLLLVTIDTLRADRVGAYGSGLGTTPALDALALRGARFEQVQSASPLTGPSHATLLTGQYPPVHGVRDNARFVISSAVPTLAERLKRAGYDTAAFVGAFPLAGAFGFARGFDSFDEGLRAAAAGSVAERPADEVADAARRWLAAERKRPFFAWVHFFDPHEPYAAPAPYRDRFHHPYDAEVAFADAQLGRLLEALRSAGHLDQMFVAVLSDHGEGLGEHGESTHGLLLYESTLRVPFVIAGPGVALGRIVRERVGTIDVLPTLLGLVGLPVPEGLPGRDLGPALAGRAVPINAVYAESLYGRLNCRWAPLRALTEGDWKVVEGSTVELFDLGRDTGEQRDRAREEPDRTTALRTALRRAVDAMAPGGDRVQRARLRPADVEALRSLGYVASGGGGDIEEPGLPDPRERRHVFEALRRLGGAAGPRLGPALQEVATIARQEQGNPFAYEMLAVLGLRAGRLDIAAPALARYLDLEPGRADVRSQYGGLLRTLGRLEEAERELRRALAESGAEAVAARLTLADTLVARGRVDEAEKLLAEVLSREPASVNGLVTRARLRIAQGRLDEAIEDLETAAAGGDVDALLELGEAYALAGRTAASGSVAERALARSPAHPWALALAGHALVLEGRGEEGISLLEKALRAGPRRAQVWLRLAAGFDAAGRRDLAQRCRTAARGGRP